MFVSHSKIWKWTAALLLTTGAALAQANDPPGTIDGSVVPDQIPDVVAFRLFLGALAGTSSASGAQTAGASSPLQPTAKQRAQLAPCALSDGDIGVLLKELGAWRSPVRPSSTTPTSPISLDAVTQAAMSVLQQQMSPSGFVSLMAWVRSEKKHMKRIPVPSMGN